MLLTVDLSNSRITMAGVDGGNVRFSCQMATVRNRTADEYAALMRLLLEQQDPAGRRPDGCILSSVVPELTLVLQTALELLTGAAPMVVGPGVKTGLNIRLDDPSELGSDFVAAAVAGEREDIKVGKINVDEQQELAMQFKVMSIPTLIVMKEGKEAERSVGVISKEEILALL